MRKVTVRGRAGDRLREIQEVESTGLSDCTAGVKGVGSQVLFRCATNMCSLCAQVDGASSPRCSMQGQWKPADKVTGLMSWGPAFVGQ